jgi:hypothetical protein
MVQYSTVQCNAEDRRGVSGSSVSRQHSTYSTVQYSYSTLKKHSTLQHSDVECSIYPHTSLLQTPLSPFLPPFISLRPLLSSLLFQPSTSFSLPVPFLSLSLPSCPTHLLYRRRRNTPVKTSSKHRQHTSFTYITVYHRLFHGRYHRPYHCTYRTVRSIVRTTVRST